MSSRLAHHGIATAIAITLVVVVEASFAVPHAVYHDALAQAVGFLAPFTGQPTAPLAFKPADWDVQVWQFNERERFDPVPIAEHGADCGAPPAAHAVNVAADAVFLCNDHLMTVVGGGYGQIVLTPNQLVDFSNGEAVIRWDMSTDLHSARDWIELNVSPYDENLARTGDFDQGPPRRSVKFLTALGAFRAEISRGFQTEYVQVKNDIDWNKFFFPSAARRDTFEAHISRTHLKIGMPAYNQWWIDTNVSDLGWSQGILQISQHSYGATKACIAFNPSNREWTGASPTVVNGEDYCPTTWHWDNVGVSPSVPFSIIKPDRCYADASSPTLTLARPAPANAMLRFAGLGSSLQFSIDNGATWTAASAQPSQNHDTTRWITYWTPIPAGATAIRFRGGQGDWIADGASVFAQDGGSQPPPPSATATPTMTPIPSPSATATPTQTLTAATCEVLIRISGQQQWVSKPLAFCQGG